LKEILNILKSDYYSPVSFDQGFNILNPQTERLPYEFHEWEVIFDQLAVLISNYKVKEVLSKISCVDVLNSNLKKEEYLRASIIITSFAAAYFYHDIYEKKVDPASLPLCLSVPRA
jgi:hypothetical protein